MAPKGKKQASPVPEEPKEEEPKEEVSPGEILEGHFLFQDNSTYDGQYLKKGDDICLHGDGKLVSGPETFKGSFEKGSYKVGRYTSCDGATYEGHFRNNVFHGHGEHRWPDGRIYSGMWKDGYMHGKGEYQNFTFGADRVFTGFSCNGKFASSRSEQEAAKLGFLEEYSGEVLKSARSALERLAAGAEVPKEFLVQGKPSEEEEKPEAAAERAATDDLLSGPCPEKDALPVVALQVFGGLFAQVSEKAGGVRVLEDSDHKGRFGKIQLKHEQLQHVGQAVEFSAPEAEVGSISLLLLVNVATQLLSRDGKFVAIPDFAAEPKWKVAFCEMMSAAA